ncbi:hypothetical protein CLOM_g11914 [Closterium sp. NIES-68]|nr:hypothetical protein CLOM_g11914 [Closterium sp. NIES-68]
MAERFDAGSRFAIEEVEGGRQRRVVLTPGGQGLDAKGDVFLVDHAWSFRLGQAREQLETVPKLAARMAALMCVGGEEGGRGGGRGGTGKNGAGRARGGGEWRKQGRKFSR